MRKGLAAFAVLFLAAHLLSLPPTLEDIDSVNFAMGVRDFEVAHHQPHPPGYPMFIALAKISTAAFRGAGIPAPEVRGLAIWSAIGGTLVILLTFGLFRALDGRIERAAMAAVLTGACPLLWFTALRPLSDLSGLAAALAALVAVARALSAHEPARGISRDRLLVAGACLAGLAAGFRSQTAILTTPLLAFALIAPSDLSARLRLVTAAAFVVGIALWGVPLIAATGGPSAYLAALGSQAGEDFTGVVMLWTHRSARVATFALLHTFVLPWDSPVLAGIVLSLAAAGFLVLAGTAPGMLARVLLTFGPYAVFQVLFQETVTIRYALPLVIPITYLVAVILSSSIRVISAAATFSLALFALILAVPAGMAFGRVPSPVFALLSRIGNSDPAPIIEMHRRIFSESRRARQWMGQPRGTAPPPPRDYEWLELTRAWREGGTGAAWFLADPRRTDLALIDAVGRRTESFRWPFNQSVYVGGARPDEIDWHTYTEPGWFLEQGWALTPEIAGITDRDGWGPHRKPSVGWIRRRPGPAVMMIGGRHLGSAADPPVRLVAAIDDRPVASLTIAPGFFLHFETIPDGTLGGEGRFAKLTVRAESTTARSPARLGLEQFNLQAPDQVQFGFDDGWFEPEFNPETGRSWRWMSERAVIRVHNAARAVEIQLQGESPLRYFTTPPAVSLSAGGRRLGEWRPTSDFTQTVSVPADLLAASDGRVTVECSEMFVAGDREGTADRRHLALRIYSVTVRAQ